jgi:hypothetical protein
LADAPWWLRNLGAGLAFANFIVRERLTSSTALWRPLAD